MALESETRRTVELYSEADTINEATDVVVNTSDYNYLIAAKRMGVVQVEKISDKVLRKNETSS